MSYTEICGRASDEYLDTLAETAGPALSSEEVKEHETEGE